MSLLISIRLMTFLLAVVWWDIRLGLKKEERGDMLRFMPGFKRQPACMCTWIMHVWIS